MGVSCFVFLGPHLAYSTARAAGAIWRPEFEIQRPVSHCQSLLVALQDLGLVDSDIGEQSPIEVRVEGNRIDQVFDAWQRITSPHDALLKSGAHGSSSMMVPLADVWTAFCGGGSAAGTNASLNSSCAMCAGNPHSSIAQAFLYLHLVEGQDPRPELLIRLRPRAHHKEAP